MKLFRISRAFTTIFTVLLALCLGLSALAYESEADINQMLGTSSYKIVDKEGDGSEDTQYYKNKTSSIDSFMQQKLDVIEQITDEGVVLLKNENALPLKTGAKVTLFGKASYNAVYGGSSGNAAIGNQNNTNINLTFKKGLEDAGFSVNAEMWDFYASKNVAYNADPSLEIDTAELPTASVANYKDAGIVVLSRVSGEGADAAANYYELDAAELKLVAEAEKLCDKVIVVVNSPSALAVHALKADANVVGILQVGGLGARGTESIGKILSGKVNPSGKTVDIYASSSMSSPAYVFSGTAAYTNADAITAAAQTLGVGSGGTKYTVYGEGIYVGYKYYETRYEDVVLNTGNASSTVGTFTSANNWNYAEEVDYSFGFGLSYTTFDKEILSFKVENNVIKASVRVTNSGSVEGKEAIQLYVQSPYTDYDKANAVEKSAIQLVAVGKTGSLKPGSSEIVELKMDLYNIASYDYANKKCWILDEGSYYFAIGNGAHEALDNVLTAKNAANISGDESMVKEWKNNAFIAYGEYNFTENGYTTQNGLYHNELKSVTNRFDSADLNNLLGENSVKYLTRSDWGGSWQNALPNVTATSDMIDRITFKSTYTKGEPVTDKTYGADTSYTLMMAKGLEYDDPLWDNILDQLMVEEMIATVGKNFGAIDPILGLNFLGTSDNDGVGSGPCAGYSTSYDKGSTIFDGESKYSTINPRMYPSETVDASTFSPALIYKLGETMSEDCYYTGLTSLWGPGLNLHRHPYSGRNFEYFSEDSMLTYILGAEVTAGVQSNGVICTPKHFAFNDQETDRYGYAVYTNEQAARENSLRAFEGSIAVAKAKNVMTSLNRIGADWCGASLALQQEILRDEWGFDGYTITDNALEPYMCGACISLGTDKFMLLPGNDRSDVLNKTYLLSDNTLFDAVRESCHRILYVYVNSKAMNGTSSTSVIENVTPWWKAALTNVDIALGCIVLLGVTGIIATTSFRKKEEEK